MKKPIRLVSALLTFVAAFLCACETDSAGGNSISVSPTEANIGLNQSMTLSASGGETYSWTLSNTEIGYLSCGQGGFGGSVTYTAIDGLGEDQYITVTSTTSSGSKSTSTASYSPSYPASSGTPSSTNAAPVSVSSASATAVLHHR